MPALPAIRPFRVESADFTEAAMKNEWLLYTILAGLAWGTYVPMIAFGGRTLEGNRFGALLCVGVAYVLIAVLLPLGLFISGQEKWPPLNVTGLTFAGLAGVAGAVGAVGVIFATKAAGGPRATASMYIAPLIFGLAPVLNTVISLFWHPEVHPLHFAAPEHLPGWKLFAGILFVAIGAALVLFAKEEEERASKPHAPAAAVRSPTGPPA
jgi:drug/metabolite transporter (DMT)-like permease